MNLFFLATVTQFDKSCFGNETKWIKLLGLLDPDKKKICQIWPKEKQKKLKHKKFVSVCFISEMNLIFWRQLHSLTSRVLETKQTGTNFWDCWILIKQKSAKFGPKKNTKTSETQKVCFSLFHFRNEPFFLATVTQFDKSCFGNETNWNKLLGLLDHDQKKNLSNLVQRKKTKKSETQKFVSVCFISEMNFFFCDSYTV